jgi:hypothetical protein
MKYRFTAFVTVLLVLTFSLVSAQKIGGGIKAGMNIANFHGDDVEDSQSKIGFCGGGFVSFSLGIVAIQPELLYSQKGAKWEEEFLDETWRLTYKFNYLEIPVLVKMIIPVQGKVMPNLFLGPYFGFTITDPRGELEVDGTTMEDDLEGVKDTDVGVVFGGGLDFVLGQGKIVFDVRYDLGLTSLDEEGADVKNNVISFLLGYSF